MQVLIADDNKDLTESLAYLAREWQFDAIAVHNGEAALAELRKTEGPILALLDWIMPVIDGIDICRELRKDTSRPYRYVILMSGRGGKERMLEGLNAGADDYLIKPVDPNELHARLCTGKRILLLQEQLLKTQHLLREQATRDSLTGLWNRAMVMEILERELTRSQRESSALTVLMGDIDHFKTINDTYGHLVGDQVLTQTAQRLLKALRPYDSIARYGGEEFLAVFPKCDATAALNLAERLRQCLAANPVIADGREIPVTLSLGVATSDGLASATDLLRRADEAMYRAKIAGRNRVFAANAPTLSP
jgi:diguanylate cyclase (GGDEF)-like protein